MLDLERVIFVPITSKKEKIEIKKKDENYLEEGSKQKKVIGINLETCTYNRWKDLDVTRSYPLQFWIITVEILGKTWGLKW